MTVPHLTVPHLTRPCVPSRPPLPDFACLGRNATATAAEFIINHRLCRDPNDIECEGDPDGNTYCWRHARAFESAKRIVRRQRRERGM